MHLLLFVLFAALLTRPAFCQDSSFKSNFINRLINGENISQYVLPEEMKLSSRLGISYDSVKYKFLISYDIEEEIKDRIKQQKLEFNADHENLEAGFSKIVFSLPGHNYKREFFFKDSLLVSPPYYYSNNWKRVDSRYFVFYLSSPDLLNKYSIKSLEDFLDSTGKILGYTSDDLRELENKKIYYFLCSNENEVEQLTGYKAKGNYILAYDYIVSYFNCHYHELVHLLVNNKLKTLPLYTHSFFQEGIAAGLGGRGGYEKEVIKSLGGFLQQSGFGDYKSLLSYKEFQSTDASFSYPISGLYNSFLIATLGANSYLKRYKQYSGTITSLNNTSIDIKNLPPDSLYLLWVSNYNDKNVEPFIPDIEGVVIHENNNFIISDNGQSYVIKTKHNLLIKTGESVTNYRSNLFSEEMKDRQYDGEKYYIKVNGSEISLYDLYTNTLTANYAAGFSSGMEPVQVKDGYFCFSISKSCFKEDLKEAIINH